MGQDHIEKMIREKLEFHRTPTDADKIWAGIEKKRESADLPEARKNKRKLLFAFLLFICATGIGTLVILLKDDKADKLVESAEINTSIAKHSSEIRESGTQEQQSNKVTPSTKKITSKILQDDKKMETHRVKPESLVVSKAIGTDDIVNTPYRQNNITSQGDHNDGRNNTTNKWNGNGSYIKTGEYSDTENRIPTEQWVAKKSSVDLAKESAIVLDKKISSAVAITENNFVRTALLSIPQITVSRFMIEKKQRSILEWNGAFISDLPQSIEVQKPKSKWMHGIAIQAGIYRNAKSLMNGAGEVTDFPALRNRTESPLETLEFSLQYSARSAMGLYAFTGINYMYMTERFDYENVSSEIVAGENFTVAKKNINIQKKIYNHMSIVDVPVGIGYMIQKGRWGFRVGASANINIRTSTQGQQLNQAGKVINLAENSPYERNLSLGFASDMGIDYSIGKGWSISLDPSLRYYGKSFTNPESGVIEKHRFAGVKTGVRKLF